MDGKWAGCGDRMTMMVWVRAWKGRYHISGWRQAPLTKTQTLEEDTWPHAASVPLVRARGPAKDHLEVSALVTVTPLVSRPLF